MTYILMIEYDHINISSLSPIGIRNTADNTYILEHS